MPKPSDTRPVSDTVFRQVYDSPASLPGRHTWLTSNDDVHRVEEILGMPPGTIGAPLWVSGDRQQCASCDREINWLDIVSSALADTHSREMIARVILGDQKFVNVEAPRAIAGVGASTVMRRSTACGASSATTGPMPNRRFSTSSSGWRPRRRRPEDARAARTE